MKLIIAFILIVLIMTACSQQQPEEAILLNQTTNQTDEQSKITTPYEEQYQYSSQVAGCDRFRPIYEQELLRYPRLKGIVDLPTSYALSFQESSCRTRTELYKDFKQEGRLDNPTWKGGIMQVDSCWRWGSPSSCESIQDQIASGIAQLDFGLEKIQNELLRLGLMNISEHQQLTLLLVAYNRGFYVSNQAMEHYADHDFPKIITVNCTEKDVCANEGEELNITAELEGLDTFEQSLLIACRENYGYMHNDIGDYCTGPDYGINYPKKILGIRERILTDGQAAYNETWKPTEQKEFYIASINFSGYEWYVKTSINKTGPGPNYFYLNESSVYVDEQGRLHMRILNEGDKWHSSEIVNTQNLGYGTYSFELEGPIEIEDSSVIGLFTYDLALRDDKNWHHREIDIEYSRWNNPNMTNTQFIIQGGNESAHERFNSNLAGDVTISFDWQAENIHYVQIDELRRHEWNYNGSLNPTPGDERIRINLWSYEAEPQRKQEVIIKAFTFTPMNDSSINKR